jgi:hypothetical protein
MVAKKIAVPAAGVKGIVDDQLNPARDKALMVLLVQTEGAETVEQQTDASPLRRRPGKGSDEAVGDPSRFEEVHLQQDIVPRHLDAFEHGREEAVAIHQQPEAVPPTPGEAVFRFRSSLQGASLPVPYSQFFAIRE